MKNWFCFMLAMAVGASALAADEAPTTLTVVIMDPLSAPLACDCVKGYAQRKYELLGEFLTSELKRPVKVYWSESLKGVLEEKTKGKADLIIGKHSVVLADAKEAKITVQPVAQLTGRDGEVTQTGLFIVRKLDPAKSMADLKGYRVLFGPADCDEKSASPMKLLKKAGLPLPSPVETSPSCSDAAKALLALPESEKAAAVVSSYAQPLLEGCGSIKKGDVRVIGESEPVPFITAFVDARLDKDVRGAITEALLKVGNEAKLLIGLETEKGFLPFARDAKNERSDAEKNKTQSSLRSGGNDLSHNLDRQESEWPQFRGPFRDGTVQWLPAKLPERAEFDWKVTLPSEGVGGIAVAKGCVIAGGRDALDQKDLWTCLDADTGASRWSLAYPAPGRLDYGNSPRATPLIDGEHAWLLGAFGHLHCVRLSDGHVEWNLNLATRFQMPLLTWGLSGSPLLAAGRLIVQPGGNVASLVALSPATGDVLWSATGLAPGHASFLTSAVNGEIQLVGYDKSSLGGWDIATGERKWSVVPPEAGDFNVPSPIIYRSGFVLVSENNGARVYTPRHDGKPGFEVAVANKALSPDSHSPVVSGDRLLGIDNGLHSLSLGDDLKSVWRLKDRAFRKYGSLIASTERLLALTFKEELILIDPHQAEPVILSRLQLSEDGSDCWSHPALANGALYLRLGRSICRLDLNKSNGSL